MKIKLFTNKLSKQLTFLILIVTILPMIFLSFFSLHFIKERALRNLQIKLQLSAKNLSLDIEERIKDLTSEIEFLSQSNNTEEALVKTNKTLKKHLSDSFIDIIVINKNKAVQSIFFPNKKPTSFDFSKPTSSKPTLNISKGNNFLYITQSIKGTSKYIVGIVNSKYLWQIEKTLPSQHAISCIINNNLKPIYCSNNKINFDNLATINNSSLDHKEPFEINLNNEPYMFSSWKNSAQVSFDSPKWIIITGSSISKALSPLYSFIYGLIAVFILIFSIIIYFSFSRIKRLTAPISYLKEKSKSIIDATLNKDVTFDKQDELQDIIKSFDLINNQIGSQKNTLATLSRIDRLILATSDINTIIEVFLQKIVHSVFFKDIMIYLAGKDNILDGKIFYCTDEAKNKIKSKHTHITQDDLDTLTKNKRFQLISNIKLSNSIDITNNNENKALLLPIILNNKFKAIVLLSYQKDTNLTKEELKNARALADRLGVAISNASWKNKFHHKQDYDHLTGLPTRSLFSARLLNTLQDSHFNKTSVGLITLDLDHFRSLNDSVGYNFGDHILKTTAERIASSVRNIGTLFRVGEDEFTIIISPLGKQKNAIDEITLIANKVATNISKPHKVNDHNVIVTASLGIAIYPTDAQHYAELIKAADTALHLAKSKGKNNYQFYSKDIAKEAKALLKLEDDLKKAIGQHDFELYFQPKIDTKTRKLIGAEALIRWKKGNHIISPDRFIHIAEDSGLMLTLGDWILKTACAECKKWHTKGHTNLKIAVNLSATQFSDNRIITRVTEALHDANLNPSFLELEITESTLMKDLTKTSSILGNLNKMKINIAVDDFGTGYSSLNYLKKLAVQTLKIDRSFISMVDLDNENTAIVSAILTLAKNLNLKTVAEGVEREQEFAFLETKKCDEIQGYLFSPPLSSHDFENYLNNYSIK